MKPGYPAAVYRHPAGGSFAGQRTALGGNVLKVLEAIFEHNDGPLFGHGKINREESTYEY